MNADRGIVVPGVQVDVETKQTRKVLKKEVNDQQLHLIICDNFRIWKIKLYQTRIGLGTKLEDCGPSSI